MPGAIEERFAGDVPSHTTGSGRDLKGQAGFHLQSSPLWGAAPPRPYVDLLTCLSRFAPRASHLVV